MREQNKLLQEFNQDEETTNELALQAIDAFQLPTRNWNLIIENYNTTNKRKFPFTAVQCKLIIDFVKKGILPKSIFRNLGISYQKYTSLVSQWLEIEDKLEELRGKAALDDKEYDLFQAMMRNPTRILMSDIDRAEGAAELADWERFNEMANSTNDLQAMKMKAKYKDFFSDRPTEHGGFNVNINLGSDFIDHI